jgi:hypothetical protein
MRLHLRAPDAEEAPQDGKWNPNDTLSAECGYYAKNGDGDQSDEYQAGTEKEPMSNGNPEGKEPSRAEQRYLTQRNLTQRGAQSSRGWTIETWPEVGRSGFHRAQKSERILWR